MDHVCCSIQYPNAWYFKKARKEERLFLDWVVLLIDARYLWQAGAKFCQRNAAAGRGKFVRSGVAAFEALFADTVEGRDTYRRGPRHPDFLPTDEQAEVLIPDRIGRGDVNGVVVQDEKQAALEISRLDLAGLTVPRFVIVPKFFDPYALSGSLRSGRLPVEREYHRGGGTCLTTGKDERSIRSPRRGRRKGALLAFAAGDALGWPQEMRRSGRNSAGGAAPRIEFRTWTRRGGGRYRPYEEVIDAGAYSDDTQLTLAVARSRTNHGADWWKAFMQVELPLWTIYERGGGGATKRAAQVWTAGRPPWQSAKTDVVRRYFDAGGNGVAMRVLPHALLLAEQDDPTALVHDVVRDGSATHGHPRALVGATLQAYAAWSLLRRKRTLAFGELLDLLIDERRGWGAFPGSGHGGETWFAAANRAEDESYERIWDRTVNEALQLLEVARNGVRAGALADDRAVLDKLGCFGRHKGAGTVTAAAAAYLVARHAAQPAHGRHQGRLRGWGRHRHACGDDRRPHGVSGRRRVDPECVARTCRTPDTCGTWPAGSRRGRTA